MTKLAACPDCSQEISNKAETCPGCGKRLRGGFFVRLFKGYMLVVAGIFVMTIVGFVAMFIGFAS